MKTLSPWIFLLMIVLPILAQAEVDSMCKSKCIADTIAKEFSGPGGGVETGARCGKEEGTKNRPKTFRRGHTPPDANLGTKWISSGISDEYEGKAVAHLEREGKELVIVSSCYTTGKFGKTELAKYRWWGKWSRPVSDDDHKRVEEACSTQCSQSN